MTPAVAPAHLPTSTLSRASALAAWFFALALFAPVVGWLVHIWSTSMYDAHGALVPLITLAMILGRRRALAAVPRAPAGAGLWLVSAGILLLLAGLLMDFNMLGGLALVIAIMGMVWTLWGRAMLWQLSFPLGFLLLMLPLNYPLEIFAGYPLRVLSVKLTAAMLHLGGLNAEVQGTLITTTQFQVAIESPCSGLKTLSALLMTGLVLAHFLHPRWRERALLLLLIPPVAIVANAIRNMVIVLLGHYRGREVAMGALHTFSGLLVFLLAVALLILISEVIQWRRPSTSA